MRYWTTADRPVREQFSYWREVICEAFTPLATERKPSHFPAGTRDPGITSWVQSQMLTSTNCAELSSKTQLITHGKPEVRRTTAEHVFVNLQLSGHHVVSQDGRTCVVPAGGFALVDTTREYDLEFFEDPAAQEWRVVSFRVPRANLVPLLADPYGFTSIVHDSGSSGTANLVASTMLSIWRNINDLHGGAAEAAESAFTTMLAAGVGGGDAVRDGGRENLDAALRAAINRYVAAYLRSPEDLSATRVAQRFGVSVRKLHGLYEGTGRTFAQTVMALRVEGCARELAAGGAGRSMTQMAARWGFADLSHLNRVFRSHRGCLPSEFRDAARPTIEV